MSRSRWKLKQVMRTQKTMSPLTCLSSAFYPKYFNLMFKILLYNDQAMMYDV